MIESDAGDNYIYTMHVISDAKSCAHKYRTIGWFPDFATAERAVLANHGDMFKNGYYRYAIIEEIPSSVSRSKAPWWYEAYAKTGSQPYIARTLPVYGTRNCRNWAMG